MTIHGSLKTCAYTPFVRVPSSEPASEGGRLKPLLDQDDRGIRISTTRVCAQVLLAAHHCLFAFYSVGLFANPQKHLIRQNHHDIY